MKKFIECKCEKEHNVVVSKSDSIAFIIRNDSPYFTKNRFISTSQNKTTHQCVLKMDTDFDIGECTLLRVLVKSSPSNSFIDIPIAYSFIELATLIFTNIQKIWYFGDEKGNIYDSDMRVADSKSIIIAFAFIEFDGKKYLVPVGTTLKKFKDFNNISVDLYCDGKKIDDNSIIDTKMELFESF